MGCTDTPEIKYFAWHTVKNLDLEDGGWDVEGTMGWFWMEDDGPGGRTWRLMDEDGPGGTPPDPDYHICHFTEADWALVKGGVRNGENNWIVNNEHTYCLTYEEDTEEDWDWVKVRLNS